MIVANFITKRPTMSEFSLLYLVIGKMKILLTAGSPSTII